MEHLAQTVRDAQRIVIKVGSNILLAENRLNLPFLYTLAEDIHELRKSGKSVLLVTSGSVATGMAKFGTTERPKDLPTKQAYAAVGQMSLMWEYERAFRVYGIPIAQVLLTRDDLESRKRYLNSQNTLLALFDLDVLPIVNENDTVVTDEIRFGDNDTLSAMVAGVVKADVNIILSDIDGFYTANPQLDPNAEFLPLITKIDSKVEAMAGLSTSSVGTGGMVTKISAARKCINAGIDMIITSGRTNHPISRLLQGARGTLFRASIDKVSARKRWILQTLKSHGSLIIDSGAEAALMRKEASLLPIGVKAISGEFERGECVQVHSQNGTLLAKGLVSYSSEEARQIYGRKSSEIETILGYVFHKEMIHKDNLVIMGAGEE
ncbi:glutamate 5-kinase [Chrysiogenes arsenatis]|uniref:glutamate 5-kinase n=1 Tax=Chrysiogenes arsenatis TaxID=309797 RepID=UPI000552DC2D|nr:glutamate 5-kinase [Chrysiogenes arsenatis]